jgi:hypothetical protein
VHGAASKCDRYLNCFQHERYLEVHVPRVCLQDGVVRQVKTDGAGRVKGYTLLFAALMPAFLRQNAVGGGAPDRGELASGRSNLRAICGSDAA